MIYLVDPVAQASRHFSKEIKYSQITWSKLDQVVDAFRQRIADWYLDPANELAKNGHFAFSVMALNCLLIDTLSQFEAGIDSSDRSKFKGFIRTRLPSAYSQPVTPNIRHEDGRSAVVEDVADALYHGFRCGILHTAHITPYGGVDPGASTPVRVEPSGKVKYKDTGTDCPSVIINPLILLKDVTAAFEKYIRELMDPSKTALRDNFKKKFSTSFGVDLSAAT